MTELPLTYTTEPRPLSAALCDATGHLSMASLETRLIVAATRHADLLGVGYRELAAKGLAWVLSRMSIEMTAMPGILDVFSITTWVESFNRHLSYRNFAIHGADGSPIGFARSLWACIDINLRRTSELGSVPGCETALECPIAPIQRVSAPGPDAEVLPAGFTYSDLDFNRHVNSARYLERIADALGLDWHDSHRITRLDIAYLHETLPSTPAVLRIGRTDDAVTAEFADAESGTALCRARLAVENR